MNKKLAKSSSAVKFQQQQCTYSCRSTIREVVIGAHGCAAPLFIPWKLLGATTPFNFKGWSSVVVIRRRLSQILLCNHRRIRNLYESRRYSTDGRQFAIFADATRNSKWFEVVRLSQTVCDKIHCLILKPRWLTKLRATVRKLSWALPRSTRRFVKEVIKSLKIKAKSQIAVGK